MCQFFLFSLYYFTKYTHLKYPFGKIVTDIYCFSFRRYSKLLFLPMGSSIPLVKREMRNLCILRMIHGFCQGLPLLFVQGFLMATKNPFMDQVHTVSVALSFFGICWSLASFNKNVRSKDVDKLVLTWIGK